MFGVFCIIAFVLAVARILGLKALWFQAIGHLFVGYGFGRYFADKGENYDYLVVAITLSVVELLCFLAGKFLS